MGGACFDLSGRNVIVTGCTSGIGRAVAVRLAESGAVVACLGRSAEKLEALCAELLGERHKAYTFDSGDLPGVEAVVATAAKEMGPFSGLVHSAGASSFQLLRDMKYETAEEMMRINYLAFLALSKGACRKGRFVPSQMSVVGISSHAALSPDPALSAYAASKAALNAAAIALAKEYAGRGVRFNVVAPSYVNTPMNDALKASIGEVAFEERVRKSMPLGMIEPDDVADSVSFLLSDSSRRTTGSIVVIDGGGNGF